MKPVLGMYAIELDVAHTPEEGLKMLKERQYDILLLDVMLPRINGLELCRMIRALEQPFCDVPVIMLSACKELVDVVVGLETGADDYVGKPFEPRELVARINAVRRRFNDIKEEVAKVPQDDGELYFRINDDTLKVNVPRAQAHINDRLLDVTSMEFEILLTLCKNPSEVISREKLLERCNGYSTIYSRGIVAMIYRLRNKIKAKGAKADFIRTVRSRGYAVVGHVSEL
ncbi:hypothetical protein BGP75_20415 [Motiliproteus sp. MSK22-1]|nr:hypothetical protein BGP75_20415 [Motiliproteus sp. MSK22-1]